jgi:anti-anti-sigma factor
LPFPERLDQHGLLRGRIDHVDGHVELFLAGDLDLGSADGLGERVRELAALTPGDVILDLEEIVFLGSTGISALVRAHQEIAADGRRLVLRNVNGSARRVLELTGLIDQLNLD